MKILGIDPGSRLVGFGCLEKVGAQLRVIEHGTLKIHRAGQPEEDQVSLRLKRLFEELNQIIVRHMPDVLVVERVFFSKNPSSVLKLGQARGVVLLCGGLHSLSVVEYSPTEVKGIVSGFGRSDKRDVAFFLKRIFGDMNFETFDSSDALALAFCHAQVGMPTNSGAASLLGLAHQKRRSKSTSMAEAVSWTLTKSSKPGKV